MLTAEVLDKSPTLITTALGFVVASPGDEIFGRAGGELAGQSFYAILVTVVVILATERAKD